MALLHLTIVITGMHTYLSAYITALVLSATLGLITFELQADPLARQQQLSRRLQEQQFDLKLPQTQRLPPALRQPQQTHNLDNRLQRQDNAQRDLYEQQRRELLHQPTPSVMQQERQREAQALDFKLNNSR